VLELVQPGGVDADLERALLELGDDVPDTPRQTSERRELREDIGSEPVRLQPVLDLARNNFDRLLLDQRDRVELRVEDP